MADHAYDHWRFPHESLDVYQDSLKFLGFVNNLPWKTGSGEVKRHLTRAALSVTLNICEGRSQRLGGNSGVNFYRIALGSAGECSGALEALVILFEARHEDGRRLVRRIGARLAGLIASDRISSPDAPREP